MRGRRPRPRPSTAGRAASVTRAESRGAALPAARRGSAAPVPGRPFLAQGAPVSPRLSNPRRGGRPRPGPPLPWVSGDECADSGDGCVGTPRSPAMSARARPSPFRRRCASAPASPRAAGRPARRPVARRSVSPGHARASGRRTARPDPSCEGTYINPLVLHSEPRAAAAAPAAKHSPIPLCRSEQARPRLGAGAGAAHPADSALPLHSRAAAGGFTMARSAAGRRSQTTRCVQAPRPDGPAAAARTVPAPRGPGCLSESRPRPLRVASSQSRPRLGGPPPAPPLHARPALPAITVARPRPPLPSCRLQPAARRGSPPRLHAQCAARSLLASSLSARMQNKSIAAADSPPLNRRR